MIERSGRRSFIRKSEKEHLVCSGKGAREMVPRNINIERVRRKPVGYSHLLKINKYKEKYI